MTYKITFLKQAKKEWDNLSPDVQAYFKKKLLKVIENPHIPKCKVREMKDCYKVKLSTVGYRLVYKRELCLRDHALISFKSFLNIGLIGLS